MKTLDSDLETHLAGKRYQLCTALIVTLRDGSTKEGFIDHQEERTVDSVVCSPTRTYAASQFKQNANLAVGNAEFDVILSSAGISDADVLNGKYNGARYKLYLVKYTDPIAWHVISAGWLGEASQNQPIARIEARDLAQALQGPQGERASPTCRNDLGDVNCGISLATHTVTGTITGIDEDKVAFTDSTRTESVNFFAYGLLTWTTGAQNAGRSMEVKSSTSGGKIVLAMPMGKSFATGDSYSVYRGCNRLPTTCKTVFNNLARIRAEVFLVGDDELGKFGRQ